MNLADEQTCRICGISKPLSEYHKSPERKSRIDIDCKPCRNARTRERYRNNREYRLATNAAYLKANRERVNKVANNRHVAEYQTKGRARAIVVKALRKGLLTKQPCTVCQNPKVDFHHSASYEEKDYLIGQWLCRAHHAEVHVKLREVEYANQ